jgi:hypothetical protein
VERLEDESHPLAPQRSERVVVQLRDLDTVDDDRARVRAIESGDQS